MTSEDTQYVGDYLLNGQYAGAYWMGRRWLAEYLELGGRVRTHMDADDVFEGVWIA
jgi:hypothetical protein